MNEPIKYTEARVIPYEDQESINHFTECLCKNMLDSVSHKILDFISSNRGEHSFRLHSVTAVNEPMSQSTEFRLVLEVLKITRCKNCAYSRGDAEKYCSIHPYRGLAEPWNDDWFCGDGKEKDHERTENN